MSIHGTNPLRGEVWWVRLDQTVGSEIAKTRPCLVVSLDILNRSRRTVVVIPISSSAKPIRNLCMSLACGNVSGVAVIDQIRASAKERFGRRVGRLSAVDMAVIDTAMRRVLGLFQ